MAIESFSPLGKQNPPDEEGELVCVKPFPCMPLGFWPLPGFGSDKDVTAAKARFNQAYFAEYEGLWCECIRVYPLPLLLFSPRTIHSLLIRPRRSHCYHTFEIRKWRGPYHAWAFRWRLVSTHNLLSCSNTQALQFGQLTTLVTGTREVFALDRLRYTMSSICASQMFPPQLCSFWIPWLWGRRSMVASTNESFCLLSSFKVKPCQTRWSTGSRTRFVQREANDMFQRE